MDDTMNLKLSEPPLAWNWNAGMAQGMRFPFAGAEHIAANFSQAWQDIFILSMLDGKRNGRYLEIGGHVPISNNNTYLLHKEFGWSGATVEFDPSHFHRWLSQRPHSHLTIADALTLDYEFAMLQWFGADVRRIDYLQLDIDPSFNTLRVLKKLPLEKYRFSVITFETDVYAGDTRARDESRAILGALGYELVARDVCVFFEPAGPDPIPFEDWWVDPQEIDAAKIEALKQDHFARRLPQKVLFN
jgi:hypothetical protein